MGIPIHNSHSEQLLQLQLLQQPQQFSQQLPQQQFSQQQLPAKLLHPPFTTIHTPHTHTIIPHSLPWIGHEADLLCLLGYSSSPPKDSIIDNNYYSKNKKIYGEGPNNVMGVTHAHAHATSVNTKKKEKGDDIYKDKNKDMKTLKYEYIYEVK